jgi:hypothetical protein
MPIILSRDKKSLRVVFGSSEIEQRLSKVRKQDYLLLASDSVYYMQSFGRQSEKWKNNIKMNLREMD